MERQKIADVCSESTANRWYEVWRLSAQTDREGRTSWICSCPSRRHPCKHLYRLWSRAYTENEERLTPFGLALLPSRAAKEAERAALERAMTARVQDATRLRRPILYTIGHGSRELSGFVTQVESYGVTLLVDVRSFPSSRWSKQFDRANLSRPGALGPSLRYRHMPELGGYNRDKTLRTKDENWAAGIGWLADRAQRETLAIFCMETDPSACHRTQTIEPALRDIAPDLVLVHLLAPRAGGASRPSRQLGLLS